MESEQTPAASASEQSSITTMTTHLRLLAHLCKQFSQTASDFAKQEQIFLSSVTLISSQISSECHKLWGGNPSAPQSSGGSPTPKGSPLGGEKDSDEHTK